MYYRKEIVSHGGMFLAIALGFFSCTLGPNYSRPVVSLPDTWQSDEIIWSPAVPSAGESKGTWWYIYNDPTLSSLIEQLESENYELKAAASRVEQVRAQGTQSRSSLWPSLALSASSTRSEFSDNRDRFPGGFETANDMTFELSYEVDLWGRVRRTGEAASAQIGVQSTEYENVKLLLQAELASTYFTLRALTEEQNIVEKLVAQHRNQEGLNLALVEEGSADLTVVNQARAALSQLKEDRERLQQTIDSKRNALATLLGQTADTFNISTNGLMNFPPYPAATLPSTLLERRPDIASAEYAVMKASSEIGIAEAALYPSFSLISSGGLSSSDISDLIRAPSRVWSLGPALTLPLFQGYSLKAQVTEAEHRYLESVHLYRSKVLVAVNEVFNSLAYLTSLRLRDRELQDAIRMYRNSLRLSEIRFSEGLTDQLAVLKGEQSLLESRRKRIQLLSEAYSASVGLVKALGGGYQNELLHQGTRSPEG